MYMTHPLLALLATVISPLNYFIVKRAGYLSGLYGVVQNAALASSNQVAVEALGAIRTVQANTGEVGEARFFAGNINRFLRVVLVTVITQTVVIFTQLGLSKARDVLVLGYGMWEVITGSGPGRLTIGSFTAFNTYVSLYEQGFSSIASIWISLRQVLTTPHHTSSPHFHTIPPHHTSAPHLLTIPRRHTGGSLSPDRRHPLTRPAPLSPGPRVGGPLPAAHGPLARHRGRRRPRAVLVPRGPRAARRLLPLPRRHGHGQCDTMWGHEGAVEPYLGRGSHALTHSLTHSRTHALTHALTTSLTSPHSRRPPYMCMHMWGAPVGPALPPARGSDL